MVRDTEAEEVFHSLVRITVGDGKRTYFWKDRWIRGQSAKEIAPEVWATVSTRRKNSRMVSTTLHENGWMLDVAGVVTDEVGREMVRLWIEISSMERDSEEPDAFLWPCAKSGKYTARETYKRLCQGNLRSSTAEPVWKSFAPLKCKISAG